MSDEVIIIEIQDKIDASIGGKLKNIAEDSIKANAAIAKLQISLSKISLNAIRAEKLALAQNKVKISSEQLSIAVDRAALAHLRLEQAQKRNSVSAQRVESTNKATSNSFAAMGNKLLVAAAAYVSVSQVIELGNAYVGLQNKLKVVTTSEAQLSEVSERLFAIANRSRGPIEETAAAFSRFDLALKPLGRSQEEVLRMTETVNKAMTVAGATTGEQAAGLLQLSQAFNKGKLDGDEFRTVMELMPSVADAIAKKMGVARGELLLLAPQGKITAKVLSEALSESADIIDNKFAKTVPTISQAMTVFRNSLVSALGEVEKGTGVFSKFALSLIDVSNYMQENNLKIMSVVSAYSNVYIGIVEVASIIGKFVSGVDSSSGALDYMNWYLKKVGLSIAFMADNLKRATSIMMFAANIAKGMSFDKAFVELKDSITATNGAMAKLTASEVDFDKKLKTETAKKELTADINKLGIEYTNLNSIIEKSKKDKTPIFKSDLIALKDMGDKLKNLVDKKERLYGAGLRPASEVTSKPIVDLKGTKNELTRSQTLAKINAELDKEAGTLQRLSPEREIYNRMTEIQIQLANKKMAGGKIGIEASEQELAAIREKITAIETEKKVSEERNRIYNESVAPSNNYANTLSAATQLLEQGSINQDEYNRQVLLSGIAYKTATDPLYEYNKQIAQESQLLKFSGMQQEVENRLMQLRNELIAKGNPLAETEVLLQRKRIEGIVLENRVSQEKINLLQSLGMTTEEFKIKQLSLAAAMATVNSPDERAALTVAAFSDVLSSTQLGLDAELAMYKKHQEEINTLLAKGVIDTKIAEQAKSQLKLKFQAKDYENADKFFGNMASLTNSSNRDLFEIGKAAAIAQATISGYRAVQEALHATGNSIVDFALAASVGVMTANNIAGIMNTKMAGYEAGGFTGMGGRSQVAGVVHGQEFVMNAASTARNRPMLEAMNRGASVGTSAQIGVIIQNYGTSKEFEVQKINENEIRIIARDEASNIIKQQTPKLVASEIANPNSVVSKSLSQNTQTPRRR